MGKLGQSILRQAVTDRKAFRKTGERRLKQLDQSLVCTREDRCERDSKEIERRGEWKDVKVGDGDEALLACDDNWIVLRGIQLDFDLPHDEGQCVARRAVDVG